MHLTKKSSLLFSFSHLELVFSKKVVDFLANNKQKINYYFPKYLGLDD